ncbi:MAG: AAA family ATPase [Ignavibacteriales bacterium]|nr:AAA family ATPase [Ignavibacteriales bacterium]
MNHLKSAKHNELTIGELKQKCEPKFINFKSTSNVPSIQEIIGQERALKALKVGVALWSPGYNIFITGLSGTGKATTVKQMLETIRPQCPTLYDYAYVNNFENDSEPILIVFTAGDAIKFKRDLISTIQYLQTKIPQVLEGDPFKNEKKKIVSEFSKKENELMVSFEEKLKTENFSIGQVKVGELSRPEIVPVIDNQPVLIQQIEEQVRLGKINKEKAAEITQKFVVYQEELQGIFRQGLQLSQDYQSKLQNLEKKTVRVVIVAAIGSLKEKYKDEKIKLYLEQVENNIFETLDVFKGAKPKTEQTEEGIIIDYFKEYEVNIILDNSNVVECPIIIETTPSYNNIFGTIEKFSDGKGGWYSDFTRIKAGSILKANGGYLVLNASDAIQEPGVWKALKRVLLYSLLEIQDFVSYYQFSPSILKPEPIEVNTKIIFIGSSYLYSILASYEDDFKKLFKIKSDFDYEMNRNEKNLEQYIKVVKKIIENEKLMEFDKDAIAKVLEYASRYADNKTKLTTRFSFIADLLREANFWAGDNGSKLVSGYHVQQAYNSARDRHSLYESKISEMIKDNELLIDTDGERIGQVNGLAVYGTDYYSFGKPTRITATVSLGIGNIINVDREAGLSGNTHNKGMLIISGYFRETFGQKTPLSFSASLVFEQGYGMIDGDSASCAEICVLLSTLAEIPIKQSLAITGSVNQKGDVQPIGGVNEKIEGYFDVCKARGLDKKHGVIIPFQNVKNLMLNDKVIEAVKKGDFHVYPISRIEEAIEILTGVKAGKKLANGSYQARTIFGMVESKLKLLHQRTKVKKKNSNNSDKNHPAKKK